MNVQVPPLKPGVLTSDLWYSVLVSGFGMLVTSGKLTPDQADAFVKGIIAIVGGLTTIIPIVQYLWSRYALKKAQLSSAIAVTSPQTTAPNPTVATPGNTTVIPQPTN